MIKQSELVYLYADCRLSVSEIAKKLDVSTGSVNWWMAKYKIKKRNRSEANYAKYNKDGDPFKIKKIDNIEDAITYGFGLGLFWGEGNKISKTSLRLGNTDPDLLKAYIKFLRKVCQVKEEKIRFGLQLFNDSDQDEAMNFWLSALGVARSQFMETISVVPPQGKGSYRKKNKLGVVTVYVNNIKLVDWMHSQLRNFR